MSIDKLQVRSYSSLVPFQLLELTPPGVRVAVQATILPRWASWNGTGPQGSFVLVLGIDAGASKTECLLSDGEGRILAKARGPGANFQLFAEDEVEFVLAELTSKVLAGHARRADLLCIGMAGADRERDRVELQRILARIGCATAHLVTNDALIALVAGSGERYGVVLIVGTGATAYGVNRKGGFARASGWGPLLGDEGSAYWMGLQCLRAVVRAQDGRARMTLLESPVLEQLGVSNVDALVHRVYQSFARNEIAGLAPLVQRAADLGDDAAQAIIDEAVRELLRAAESVIGRLELAGERFALVLSGGLWKAVPVLRQDLAKLIPKIAPWAEVKPAPALNAPARSRNSCHAGRRSAPTARTRRATSGRHGPRYRRSVVVPRRGPPHASPCGAQPSRWPRSPTPRRRPCLRALRSR